MNKKTKKVLSAVMSLTLMLALVIGCFEIVGMLDGPAVEVQAITSGGSSDSGSSSDSTSGGSSASTSSSSSGSSSAPAKKKTSKAKKKLSVKGNTVAIEYAAAQSQDLVFSRNAIMTVKNAGGKKTYKIVKVNKSKKNFKISKKGKLTVKKGLAPGTYTVKIKVKTKGSKKYKAGTKTAKVTIVINPPVVAPTPAPAPAPAPEPTPSVDPGTNPDQGGQTDPPAEGGN